MYLASGFAACFGVPVFGILAGITETISTKECQQQRHKNQQDQPSEHFFIVMHCKAPCLVCIYPEFLFSGQGVIYCFFDLVIHFALQLFGGLLHVAYAGTHFVSHALDILLSFTLGLFGPTFYLINDGL